MEVQTNFFEFTNRKVFGASVIWLPPTSTSKHGKVLVCGGTSWMEVALQVLKEFPMDYSDR